MALTGKILFGGLVVAAILNWAYLRSQQRAAVVKRNRAVLDALRAFAEAYSRIIAAEDWQRYGVLCEQFEALDALLSDTPFEDPIRRECMKATQIVYDLQARRATLLSMFSNSEMAILRSLVKQVEEYVDTL